MAILETQRGGTEVRGSFSPPSSPRPLSGVILIYKYITMYSIYYLPRVISGEDLHQDERGLWVGKLVVVCENKQHAEGYFLSQVCKNFLARDSFDAFEGYIVLGGDEVGKVEAYSGDDKFFMRYVRDWNHFTQNLKEVGITAEAMHNDYFDEYGEIRL